MASLVHGLIGVFSLALLSSSYGVFNSRTQLLRAEYWHEIHAICPWVMRLTFCEFMLAM
jgi:hypothetical protein